nr:hypothetical protein [Tanacetum cinerariifolium]
MSNYLILSSSMVDMLPLEVTQTMMCDKKNSVRFTNTIYLVLSPEFKLPAESQVLLRVHRENKMYNVNLMYIVPSGDLTCLFAKATLDESNIWHRRLGHINFKTMNKLVKELEDITYSDDEDAVGVEANFNNLETSITVSPILTIRVHKDHHVTQIISDLSSATQIRIMVRVAKDQVGLSQMFNDDFHTCMFACFLSQEEPKRKVRVLVDLPYGKRAIGTKWVFKNKKDERGIVVWNKARFVAQGHTQEEGINYEEVFAPLARIEAIRLFLAYASFMGFMVYQIDVKSAFLYGTIEEEALYGLHQAPKAWYETLANYLLENGFQK